MQPLPHPQPKVNLNGSSKGALVEQRLRALTALDQLRVALNDMAPHGRDYQRNDPEDFARDRDLHRARYNYVDTLYASIEAEAHFIDRQGRK
jgi:hypothetical protein